MEVQPQPLTPSFFFNRTKDISPSVSAAIFSTFEKSGLLDSSGFLLEDPRYGQQCFDDQIVRLLNGIHHDYGLVPLSQISLACANAGKALVLYNLDPFRADSSL